MKKYLILLASIVACFAFVVTVTLAQQRFPSVTSVKQETKEGVRSEIGNIKNEALLKRQELENELKKRSEETKNQIVQKREEIRAEVGVIRNDVSASKIQLQTELKNKAKEASLEFTKNRNEAKAEMEKKRIEFKKEVADKRLEVKEQITKKRTELAEKLKVIKDEKKQQIALKIGDQFQEINSKVLASFTNLLNKEEIILQKISARADIIAVQGGDISSLKEVFSFVDTEIAKAREAIVIQTAKVYTISVNTEETLKNDTGSTGQELQNDLNIIKALIKNVHEALKNAVDVFQNTSGSEKIKVSQSTTTVSASSTNQ